MHGALRPRVMLMNLWNDWYLQVGVGILLEFRAQDHPKHM